MPDYASSIQGAGARVTRLAADGSLASGPKASYYMTSFMRVSFTPEFEEGEDITEKDATGNICVSYKTNDTLKRITLELAICDPDPEFTELLAGGTLLAQAGISRTVTNKALTANVATITTSTAHGFAVGDSVTVAISDTAFDGTYIVTAVPSSTTFSYAKTGTTVASTAATGTAAANTTVGYAAAVIGVDSNPNGSALEVWSKAIVNGRQASVNPYWQWVFPYVQLRPTGERVVENGLLANTFSGWGTGNAMFDTGTTVHAVAAWPFISDRPYQYARTSSLPNNSRGYVAIA